MFLRKALSITKNSTHKIIKIFGITIKLRIKKSYKINHKKIQKRIWSKKGKIRVVFLSTESSKWCYQNLYEYFEKDDKFEPMVVVSLLLSAHEGIDNTRSNIQKTYNFFKAQNINVQYGYINGEYIDLNTFEPDIVFYEQPWELAENQAPYNVAQFALTCYTAYGFDYIYDCQNIEYQKTFHKYLFKYFVPNKYDFEILNNKNCLYLGYPKIDTYLDNYHIDDGKIWKEPSKTKIIYAPHHSFESDGLKTATFKENGKLILDIAKKHPETTWIFKPHPRFKYALISNNIMNEKEIEEYYNEWSEIGNIYETGNYFDIFKTSDIMITDCCSFLAEYLPSKHPLIQLVNNDSIKLSDFGEKLVKGYYRCSNWAELENIILELEDKENDYKLKIREDFIPEIIDLKEKSSYKIYKYIKNIVKID